MSKLLSKTFLWMFVGLAVTFITGFVVSTNDNMISSIYASPLLWVLVILELGLVIFFSLRVHKMQPNTAKFCFLLYSFVSGLTFSSIFMAFELASVLYVFIISAVVFGVFGLLGYYTKIDLSKIGTIAIMALIACLVGILINIFLQNSVLDIVISIILLLVFFGFTAYDLQKLRVLGESGIDNDVVAINGAFELYLDFINIFLQLLQFIGDVKD